MSVGSEAGAGAGGELLLPVCCSLDPRCPHSVPSAHSVPRSETSVWCHLSSLMVPIFLGFEDENGTMRQPDFETYIGSLGVEAGSRLGIANK